MGKYHDLESFLNGAHAKKILVVGDYIVDHYRFMAPKALSPEAPIVCFKPIRNEFRHGGAGNVVANLCALGVETHFLTVIGYDYDGELPGICIAVREVGRQTTVKERILTSRQQIARIDTQSPTKITSASAMYATEGLDVSDFDAIVFSDYDHGCMIPNLVAPIMRQAIEKKIPTIVDSKAQDTLKKYQCCTVAIPNMAEAQKILGLSSAHPSNSDPKFVARALLRSLAAEAVALTLGQSGIFLDCKWQSRQYSAVNAENEVVDVTGAGDTVAAIIALGMASHCDFGSIIELANLAAGVKVQKLGVAAVTPAELRKMAEADDGRQS